MTRNTSVNEAQAEGFEPNAARKTAEPAKPANPPGTIHRDNFTIRECRQFLLAEGVALRYNELADSVEASEGGGPYTELDGHTEARLLTQIPLKFYDGRQAHKLSVAEWRLMRDTIAAENRVNPFRDYLKGLTWDNEPRLDRLFADSLQLEQTPFLAALSRMVLCAIVARQYEPGCKFDYMAVLKGGQGLGKSAWVRAITDGKFHSEGVNFDLDEEDFGRSLQGCVTGEAAEIVRSSRRGIEKDKSIITRQVDRYRRKFSDRYVDKPRQCVLFGTVNPGPGGVLSYDPSGQRRYPIVDCDAVSPDCKDPARRYEHIVAYWAANRDRLFAEAVALYEQGVSLELPRELWDEQDRLARAEAPDPDAELVAAMRSACDRLPDPYKAAFTIQHIKDAANDDEALEIDAVTPKKLGTVLRERLNAVGRGYRKFVLPSPDREAA